MAIKVQKVPDNVVGGIGNASKYSAERDAALSLKVGDGFVWASPPKQPHTTVSRWRNQNGGMIVARMDNGKVWVVCLPIK